MSESPQESAGTFLRYGWTRNGHELVNFRFWLASVIGFILLCGAFWGASNGGEILFCIWLGFTVLYFVWAPFVWLAGGAPPPAPVFRYGAGPHNITPLTPEQRAWVEMQKSKAPTPVEVAPEELAASLELKSSRPTGSKKKPQTRQHRGYLSSASTIVVLNCSLRSG